MSPFSRSRVLGLTAAAGLVAVLVLAAAPADAKILRVSGPLGQNASSDEAPVVIAQAVPQSVPAPMPAAAALPAPKTADQPDPPSARAADAAARAARALADEGGEEPDGVADAAPLPTAPTPAGSKRGQAVAPADGRRSSAAIKCVAGC